MAAHQLPAVMNPKYVLGVKLAKANARGSNRNTGWRGRSGAGARQPQGYGDRAYNKERLDFICRQAGVHTGSRVDLLWDMAEIMAVEERTHAAASRVCFCLAHTLDTATFLMDGDRQSMRTAREVAPMFQGRFVLNRLKQLGDRRKALDKGFAFSPMWLYLHGVCGRLSKLSARLGLLSVGLAHVTCKQAANKHFTAMAKLHADSSFPELQPTLQTWCDIY